MLCVCPQFKLDDTSYKLKPESVGRQVTTESVGRHVTTEHEETGAEDKGESHCKLLHEGFTYCTGQVSHQHQKLMSIGGAEVGLMSIGG